MQSHLIMVSVYILYAGTPESVKNLRYYTFKHWHINADKMNSIEIRYAVFNFSFKLCIFTYINYSQLNFYIVKEVVIAHTQYFFAK